MRLVTHALACVMVAAGTQAPGQPSKPATGSASLEGRVIASDSGAPIRQATVLLDRAGLQWTATTDTDGHFAIGDLAAGRYTIRITKAGFVTWRFGREPGGSVSRVEPFEIRDGQAFDRGDLRLPRGGVITGRVVDAFGDPVSEMDVHALRLRYFTPGDARLAAARHATTNDLGEYRIFGLDPGRYYIGLGLSVRDGAERGLQSTPTLRVIPARHGVAPTFYPGTANAGNATPIDVDAGGVAAGIDVRLHDVPLASLSGTIANARGGPAAGAIVMLHPARADGVLASFLAVVEPDASGTFHLVNVPPGDYRIDAVSKARMEAIGQTGSSAARPAGAAEEFASVAITVAGQDIGGISIRMSRGFTVTGRLVVEGVAALPGTTKITVAATPILQRQGVSGVLLGASGDVQPDGRFVIGGVAGGQLFRAFGFPAGWAMTAVRLNGADVTDEIADITSDVKSLEVVLSASPARVMGAVTDSAGQPVTDVAAAIVFSVDARRWTLPATRFVRSERATGGQFTLVGLPAGDYYAAAVDILEPDWPSPDSLERLRRTATTFTIAEGETKALTIVRKN
jgi:hypothetical protein